MWMLFVWALSCTDAVSGILAEDTATLSDIPGKFSDFLDMALKCLGNCGDPRAWVQLIDVFISRNFRNFTYLN